MAGLLAVLKRLPELVLEALQTVVLLVIFLLVALPLGLLWRLVSPHSSWKRAKTTRWETPEPGRDPSTLEQAGKQY